VKGEIQGEYNFNKVNLMFKNLKMSNCHRAAVVRSGWQAQEGLMLTVLHAKLQTLIL
jgi:hypothetical protein